MDLAVPVLPVTPTKMVPSVPMLMNVSMTMTICAMLMLTALTPLVVTNAHAKLHIGKAKAWSAMMVAQDVLTSTSVPPESIIASPSTVLTKTVIFQVPPECVNNNKGFTCNCLSGFWVQEGRICLDVDECDTDNRQCDENRCENIDECGTNGDNNWHAWVTCTDLVQCKCNEPGYYDNGFECFDDDECDVAFGGNDCSNDQNSECYNIDYFCMTLHLRLR